MITDEKVETILHRRGQAWFLFRSSTHVTQLDDLLFCVRMVRLRRFGSSLAIHVHGHTFCSRESNGVTPLCLTVVRKMHAPTAGSGTQGLNACCSCCSVAGDSLLQVDGA